MCKNRGLSRNLAFIATPTSEFSNKLAYTNPFFILCHVFMDTARSHIVAARASGYFGFTSVLFHICILGASL